MKYIMTLKDPPTLGYEDDEDREMEFVVDVINRNISRRLKFDPIIAKCEHDWETSDEECYGELWIESKCRKCNHKIILKELSFERSMLG